MNLTLRDILHIQKVHKCLNFGLAAQHLGISQSALSQSIAAIEKRLGIPLFVRNRRSVEPTAYAERIAASAHSIISSVADLGADLVQLRDGEFGEFSFGCGVVPASVLLEPALELFTTRHPNLEPKINVGYVDRLHQMLINNEIEFYVAALNPLLDREGLELETIFERKFSLFVRASHPLAERDATADEFVRFPCITFHAEYLKWQIEHKLTSRLSLDLLEKNFPAVSSTQPERLANVALLKDYIVVVPEWLVSSEARRQLVEITLSEIDFGLSVQICRRAGRDFSAPATRMLDVFRETAKEIMR